jgi:hypothetical protein
VKAKERQIEDLENMINQRLHLVGEQSTPRLPQYEDYSRLLQEPSPARTSTLQVQQQSPARAFIYTIDEQRHPSPIAHKRDMTSKSKHNYFSGI